MKPARSVKTGLTHLLHAIVKKRQAGVLVADEGALLDEADEYLGLGELGVELLMGTVSAFEKTCRKTGKVWEIVSQIYLKASIILDLAIYGNINMKNLNDLLKEK